MTFQGWAQIALFAIVIVFITNPLGAYMTAVFNGERTPLSPVLRPVERVFYWLCGVQEKQEQSHPLTTVPCPPQQTQTASANPILPVVL